MSEYDDNSNEPQSSNFELIEFSLLRSVDGREVKGIYGVNVAKVREVVRMPSINPLGSRVPGVAGVFELRGVPIPAINLTRVLGDTDSVLKPNQQIIVTEFSRKRAGFVVEQTHRIRRVSWDKVLPPASDGKAFMSGMTLIENNQFLFILDLERILVELEAMGNPNMTPSQLALDYTGNFSLAASRGGQQMHVAASAPSASAPGILLVDDSPLILNSVRNALTQIGYRVITAENGRVALGILQRVAGGDTSYGKIDVIVTDVEMPQMNGLMLTQEVRANPALAAMPVVLHTSLSGRANQDAGMRVGANGYVIKNDVRVLSELLKELIGRDPQAA